MRWILCLALLAVCAPAYSQTPPQAPRIETKEQTKDSPPADDNSRQNSQTATVPPPIPLQQTSNINTKKTSEDAQRGSDEASEYWTLASHRVNVTDTLLVAFTGLLFVATLFLYFATRSLVTGAERTARHELRAYMGVEHVTIQGEYRGGPPGFGKFTIRNFGKTMAKDAQIWLVGTGVTVGDITNFPLGERKSKTVVMPNEAIGFDEPINKTKEDSDLLRQNIGFTYLWGRIEYTDVFGEPHWTTFRFVSYKQWIIQDMTGWDVKTCDEGNDAT